MNHSDPSTSPPVADLGRRFGRLAFVNVLSNVTVPLAGLIDTAILGRLPDIRFLAGVALATVLFDYIYWSFGFLRMATTGETAQALGRNDRAAAFDVLYRSLFLAVAIGAGLLVLQLPIRELGFLLLGGAEGVEAAGRDYFDARIWAAPVTLCNFALLGWFLGREQAGRALVMTIVANLTNVVGDYVLILELGLGARGAGLATAASQVAMLIAGVLLLPPLVALQPRRIFDRDRLLGALRLQRDILIRTVALLTAFALFTNFSALLGTVLLAANSILLRILSFAAYLIDGIAFAVESIAGHAWGARRHDLVRRTVRLAMLSTLVASFLMGGALLLGPEPLLGLLTTHAPTLERAIDLSPWLVLVLVLAGPAYVYDGLFLGLTRGRLLRNTMIASLLIGLLPLALLALRARQDRLLWAALALFMAMRTFLLAWSARNL